MNILHINTNYLGNALHQNMVIALDKTGVKSSVFVPTHDDSSSVIIPKNNVFVSKCFSRHDRLNYYLKQKKILSAVESQYDVKKFDIVHAYTVFTDGNVSYNLHKKYGIPYVVAVRNTDINTFFKYMVHLRKRGVEILKNASAVFFLSNVYKKRLFQKYISSADAEILENKCYIMPNGIDDFWLENIYSERKTDTLDDTIKVACIGSVDKNKNMLSVAKALELLKSKGHKVSLSIAGKIKDNKIYDSLMKYDFVDYKGTLSKDYLIDVYRNSNIFVLASFKESFGMVYIEAMSQGLPVIYTRGEGFEGQFEDGCVGYSVCPDDITEIADKISKAFQNRQKLSRMSIKNVADFSWDRIVSHYDRIYKTEIS